jgi:hypothetical protein
MISPELSSLSFTGPFYPCPPRLLLISNLEDFLHPSSSSPKRIQHLNHIMHHSTRYLPLLLLLLLRRDTGILVVLAVLFGHSFAAVAGSADTPGGVWGWAFVHGLCLCLSLERVFLVR